MKGSNKKNIILVILICAFVVLFVVILLFKYGIVNNNNESNKTSENRISNELDSAIFEVNVSEDEAKDIAVEKFKELGETTVDSDDLELNVAKKTTGVYYLISSHDNSLVIRASDGVIVLVNSVKVNE